MPDLAQTAGLLRSLAIYYAQPWRRRALQRLYVDIVRPGDLVFDLGAHVGSRTRTLHALGAHVVAVEPQPLFAGFLRRTLPRSRIELVAEAVGACHGRAHLRVSRRHPTVSTLSGDWIRQVAATPGFRSVRWDRGLEVPVTTLDGLIERYGVPLFVKIDVEGMEAEILAGLSQPLPLLALEYVPAAMAIAVCCVDRLAALGRYEFNLVEGETHVLAWASWREAPATQEALAAMSAGARPGDLYARLKSVDVCAG